VACGRKIGDDCKTQLDCNEEDDSRTCDISQPGGYCTIEGCDETSCPKEAVCVRFYPAEEFLTDHCDPAISTGCDPRRSACSRAGAPPARRSSAPLPAQVQGWRRLP
jgi:hypothetical protein